MKYQSTLEIPMNTAKTSPSIETLYLPFGVLKETSIYFPWGCGGLAHIRIIHNERVLYPTNPDEWFEGNDILIKFECMYELSEAFNRFKVEGYNEDDFYPHTPITSFVVLPVGDTMFTAIPWTEG